MAINRDETIVDFDDLVGLDDSALLSWRAQARAELERLPPGSAEHAALSDDSTEEVNDRAREAWEREIRGVHR